MDAAQKLFKNNGLYLVIALALVLAAPGWAQPALTLNTNSIALTQSVTSGSVNVTSSGAAITFTPSITSINGNGIWLTFQSGSSGQQTTPATIGVQIGNTAGMTAGTYTATVTLNPSSPSGVTPASFTVTWTAGSGGGGGGSSTITVSPTALAMSAAAGFSTVQNITVTTTSTANIGITITTSVINGGTAWLSANPTGTTINNAIPGTIAISASAAGLSNGVYNGTVTVTPTSGTAVSVNVTFTVGGTGGGSLNVSPSSLNWTYNTGGAFPSQSISVTTSGGASYFNAVSTQPWLLINGQFSISTVPFGTALTVSMASGLATGSYSGQINFSDNIGNSAALTVTLSVNGGTATGLTITPGTLSFNAAVSGAAQTTYLTVTSQAGGNFTATPTANWITAVTSASTLAAGGQGTVQVTATPGGLPANIYTGSVLVNVGGVQQSVAVTMNIGNSSGGGGNSGGVAPSSVGLSYQLGTNAGFVGRPQIAITGTSGNWSATASSSPGSWLSLSPSSGSILPAYPTIVADPTGLAVGSYSGTITITTPSGTQTVNVTLAVSSGAVLSAQPSSLIFNYQTNGSVPAGQNVFFSSSDISSNNFDITGTVTSNVSWVSVTTTQKSMSVTVDPKGLTGGLYSGTITVSPAALGSITVPVVLVIDNGTGGGSGGTGPLIFTPTSLSFSAAQGASPSPQALQVTANIASSFTVTTNQSWLTVTPTSTTTPATLSVSVASSSLASGTYNGIITFNSNGSLQTVGVVLTVGSGGGGTGNISVSPTSLSFTGQTGSGTLPVQGLTISGASNILVTISTSTTSGGAWLTANPTQALAGSSINIGVNASALAAGTYQGTVTLTPNGGTAVTVPVTLTLTAPPTVTASPTSLTFSYRAGGNTPAGQSISVTGGGGSLSFTAAASSNGTWLKITPASGTTPATLTASVDPTGLTAGNYSGTITIAGTNGAPGSTVINVSLSVTAPLPTISKVTNAASYAAAGIAPGEIITLFGTDLGPTTPLGLQLDSSGKVATTLGGVQVVINGYPSPLIYVSNTQVSAVVPYELAQFASANILIKYLGQSSNGVAVNVVTTAPGIFTLNSSGTGPGAILNQNGSTNSPSNPATRGDTVVVYMTGEGQTSPLGVTGKVTTVSSTPPLTPTPLLPIAILVGGQPANYSFAGEAPGFVSGVLQLNVVLPTTIGAGDQSLVVSIGGNSSQSGVTVSVK